MSPEAAFVGLRGAEPGGVERALELSFRPADAEGLLDGTDCDQGPILSVDALRTGIRVAVNVSVAALV